MELPEIIARICQDVFTHSGPEGACLLRQAPSGQKRTVKVSTKLGAIQIDQIKRKN